MHQYPLQSLNCFRGSAVCLTEVFYLQVDNSWYPQAARFTSHIIRTHFLIAISYMAGEGPWRWRVSPLIWVYWCYKIYLGSLWETGFFSPHSLTLTRQEKVYGASWGEITEGQELSLSNFIQVQHARVETQPSRSCASRSRHGGKDKQAHQGLDKPATLPP